MHDSSHASLSLKHAFIPVYRLQYYSIPIIYKLNLHFDRKWTTELEETVANVQKQMEDVCDVYFHDIQHKAIKVLL